MPLSLFPNPQTRDEIRSYIPKWLMDRIPTNKVNNFRLLYSFASLVDAGIQFIIEGLQARMPFLGTKTAIDFIARDRQILKGPNEADEPYAARLIQWLDYWRVAGNAYSLMLAFQAYLAPGYPMIRLVTRNRPGFGSVWYTLHTNGILDIQRVNPSNWDWDSISNPERDGYWSDFWVIAYEPHYDKDGVWGDGNSFWFKNLKTFGIDSNPENISVIRNLIQQWKGSHSKCRTLILSYRANAYDPDLPVGDSLLPDGKWGKYSKDDGSGGTIKSRNEQDRYIDHLLDLNG